MRLWLCLRLLMLMWLSGGWICSLLLLLWLLLLLRRWACGCKFVHVDFEEGGCGSQDAVGEYSEVAERLERGPEEGVGVQGAAVVHCRFSGAA